MWQRPDAQSSSRSQGAPTAEPEGAVAVKLLSTDPDRKPGPELYAQRATEAVALRRRLLDVLLY